MGKAIAKRVPIFIEFFEKEMEKIQASVEALRETERLYMVVREVLLEFEEDVLERNDVRVERRGDRIEIDMEFVQGQHWKHLMPLVRRVGELMVERGIREKERGDPGPALGWFVVWEWIWVHRGVRKGSIVLRVEVPDKGTDMVSVVRTTKYVTEPRFDTIFEWRELDEGG